MKCLIFLVFFYNRKRNKKKTFLLLLQPHHTGSNTAARARLLSDLWTVAKLCSDSFATVLFGIKRTITHMARNYWAAALQTINFTLFPCAYFAKQLKRHIISYGSWYVWMEIWKVCTVNASNKKKITFFCAQIKKHSGDEVKPQHIISTYLIRFCFCIFRLLCLLFAIVYKPFLHM